MSRFREMQDLNNKYEEKLQKLNSVKLEKPEEPSKTLSPEITKMLEKQSEESNCIKNAIEELINKKNDLGPIVEQKESEILKLQESLSLISERNTKLEKKYKEAKVYYRLFKHSSLIQCKYCSKYYKQNAFVTHCQTCSMGDIIPKKKQEPVSKISISITQTLIREDENLHKPFTMYVIESYVDGEGYSIQRKYKEFCRLNEMLINQFPEVDFPDSTRQFFSKCLEDVLRKKGTVVEQRRKNLQKYLNDISVIKVIRECDCFKEFIGLVSEEQNEGKTEIYQENVLEEIRGRNINLENLRMNSLQLSYQG